MKKLQLLNSEGNLRPDAAAIWLAYQYFPDDEDSRRQALLIASDEARRFLERGDEGWKPSQLTSAITAWANKRGGQKIVSGYTALAFLLLIENGVEAPTLYASAKVVSDALQSLKSDDPVPLKSFRFDGAWEIHDQRTPSSTEDIMKAFRKNSSVAHLIASSISVSEQVLLMHVFNRTPETMHMEIQTAGMIERLLSKHMQQDFMDYWSVSDCISPGAGFFAPAKLEGNVRAFLELGLR